MPDPDCACPVEFMGAARGGIDGLLLDYNPGDLPTTNPWKKLESSINVDFDHENIPEGGTWFYMVTDTEDLAPDP